jgi:hypothetical protein
LQADQARLRRLFALFAAAFSPWRCAAFALLARLVPVAALPRLPLLRLAVSEDLVSRGVLSFMIFP